MHHVSWIEPMIKWLFKWFLRLALVSVVLVVLLYFTKDPVLRVAAEKRIRSQTGMEAQIGKFSSGQSGTATYVTIQNLKLYNTAEFSGTPFLDIPEVHLECDAVAFAQRKLRIRLLRLNLAELDIVRNAAGQTNIFALHKLLNPGGPRKSGAPAEVGGFEFQGIDLLNLSLGRAKFIDLKDARNNREIRVGLENQLFNNVKSDADVYGILFMIWLRSGGNFSLAPADLGKELSGKNPGPPEPASRPSVPAKK